jgi:hypothetical protein
MEESRALLGGLYLCRTTRHHFYLSAVNFHTMRRKNKIGSFLLSFVYFAVLFFISGLSPSSFSLNYDSPMSSNRCLIIAMAASLRISSFCCPLYISSRYLSLPTKNDDTLRCEKLCFILLAHSGYTR